MNPCAGRAPSNAPIGIFDSGVGGLSVWRSIRQALPGENLLYLADSGYAPYGDRSPDWIRARTAQLVQFLLDQGCKAIVIACNTATMLAAAYLRAHFSVPIIAIEPAVKPAAALSRSGCIALMATRRTIESTGLQNLISQHAAQVQVVRIACPGLAERVEALQLDGPDVEHELHRYLKPALSSRADTLVLGCTHYPFLRPSIERLSAGRFQIVEPSFAVASQVRRRLHAAGCLGVRSAGGHSVFISSAPPAQAQPIIQALSGLPRMTVQPLPTLDTDSSYALPCARSTFSQVSI
ncbi:glutamate racemase [Alcaligenes sp. SDU_A2]|uniref:glutamate racemase n=1 Tax=Alcaligenes sp. SDU_A2 TaxID=3136634 RepID=UPI00311F1642